MTFFVVIIGIAIGMFIFSSAESGLIGGIVGGFCAYLFSRILVLQDRIAFLEQKVLQEAAKKSPAPQADGPLKSKKQDPATLKPDSKADTEIRAPKPSPLSADPPLSLAKATAQTEKKASDFPVPEKVPENEAPDNPLEWLDIIVAYFTGGNVVVRVGIIVLFFGVGFLLKYSIENNMVPIELRLAGICLGGIVMLIIGWRLRIRKTAYALVLQGGGIGILYLTIFTALKLYHLIPVWLALLLLVALPVFSAALAVVQDARGLMVIGMIGGFLAPVLASTGSGNHVMLFTYYALLNSSILLVAGFKSWRELNLIGFVFTFGISSLWGGRSYRPEFFASTEPFLILFFCLYVTIGLLFARNQPLRQKGYIDCTMIFGTPIICFGLQSVLVRPYEYGLAVSAVGMGMIYAGLAWMILRKGSAAMRTLIESFMALGVVFGTIAIPLALDGRWTAAAWALEGSAVIWIAIRQNRPIARISGIGLQLLAGFAFLSRIDAATNGMVVINGFYLGCLAVAAGAFFSSFCLFKSEIKIQSARMESRLLLGWALFWWFWAGLHEVDIFVPYLYKSAAVLGFWAFSSLASLMAAEKLSWTDLRHVYKSLLPLMVIVAVYRMIQLHSRPSIYMGFLTWPLAFAVQYRMLYLDKADGEPWIMRIFHPVSFLLLLFLLSWEAAWWVDHWVSGAGIWPEVTLAFVPTCAVMLLTRFKDRLTWPFSENPAAYLYHALGTVVICLLIGSLQMNLFSRGNPRPLPYIPFVNPLDLMQMMVFIVSIYWFYVLQTQLQIQPFSVNRKRLMIGSAAAVFFWLNAVLIRTLHYYGNVAFSAHAMMHSDRVQTALSIFWTVAALVVMKWAVHKKYRRVWMTGAAMIGIVVFKLFTIDLDNTGTVERIISFISVGILCLVIGYLAPLPDKNEAATS